MTWLQKKLGLTVSCLQVVLLLILATETTTSSVAAGTTDSLKVVTYNIRLNTEKDGPDRWDVRKPKTFEMIRRLNPDVMGMQEVLKGQLNDLQQEFPEFKSVGVGRNDGKDGGEFSNIMYKSDRLELLNSGTFWLSDTPEVAGTTSWGNTNVRICTWAHFKDKVTGEPFYLWNTHLDHRSQPSREKSAELIVKRIKERETTAPVILTGDFNAHETNAALDTIMKAGFRDSFRMLHPDDKQVGTTNAFSEMRQPAKIDYVFVDDAWEVLEAEIHDDRIDGRWPSDHLPVSARVRRK